MRGEITVGIASFILIGALALAIQRFFEVRRFRHRSRVEPPRSTII